MKDKLYVWLKVAGESICYTLLAYLLVSGATSFRRTPPCILMRGLHFFITGKYLLMLAKYIRSAAIRVLLLLVCCGAVLLLGFLLGYLQMEFVPFPM